MADVTLSQFGQKVLRQTERIFVRVTNETHRSVQEGSEVTSAPGQPRDVGTLRASWIESYPEEFVGQTATNSAYAVPIEEGVQEAHSRRAYTRKDGTPVRATTVRRREIKLRSEVGGFHSVKLTRANFQAIVDHVVREEVGGG